MDFFKRLFGGGGSATGAAGDPHGLYFYILPDGCDEVVRLRINSMNDLSETDDGGSYFTRKLVRGVKCPRFVEVELSFDANRKLIGSDIKGGRLVDEAAYAAWQASDTQ
jgi:hypothetical protein